MNSFPTSMRTNAGTGIASALLVLCVGVGSHVVLHDLHGAAHSPGAAHDSDQQHDHDHPVTAKLAAQYLITLSSLSLTGLAPSAAAVHEFLSSPATVSIRNVVSPGALRSDEDVGLHSLLSTWLI